MAICIYPPYAQDFANNGLGILTPLECTITEEAAPAMKARAEQPGRAFWAEPARI